MFVCVCHGYRESCIEEAMENSPESLSDVYRHLGEGPRCGKCVPDILRLYQDRRSRAPGGAEAPLCTSSAPV
jgi:bacterioferritin-associated ferredoxin